MFVDTSIFIALFNGEPEAQLYAKKMYDSKQCFTSGVVIYEATAVAVRIDAGGRDKVFNDINLTNAQKAINYIVSHFKMKIISIHTKETELAIEAMGKFGNGSGSGARLGMADCFSYGCAKSYKIPLLFKGNDFVKTDITSA